MKLVIVIVTFNRLDKLIKTLECYDKQTAQFTSLIVVDNCSTDGTSEFLKTWRETDSCYSKYVISMKYNSGGSGGFYEGQKFALSLNPDWIYVSDDDAYPEPDMVERFYKITNSVDVNTVAALCATVYNNYWEIDYEHRRTYSLINKYKFIQENSAPKDYAKQYFPIHLFSYVGTFINTRALAKVGLCNPKLFIYYDDTEHSLRLSQYGAIYCYPELKVLHDSGYISSNSDDILYSWRDYYSLRNYTHMLKRHFPLSAIYISIYYIYNVIKKKNGHFKLVFNALYDCWLNRLGLHAIYKPGFQVKK